MAINVMSRKSRTVIGLAFVPVILEVKQQAPTNVVFKYPQTSWLPLLYHNNTMFWSNFLGINFTSQLFMTDLVQMKISAASAGIL